MPYLYRGGTFGIVLVALWAAEHAAPMFVRGRRGLWRHDGLNVAWGLLNAAVAGALAAVVTLWLMAESEAANFGLLHHLPESPPLRWAVGLVLFDGWMYLWHVLNHRVPFLWRFHAVHHSDAQLDATSGVRFHTGEILMATLVRMAVVPLIGLDVTMLLAYELVTRPIVLFHHADVRLPESIDRILRALIVTPRMHWVHHSRWRPETDSNYASGLSVWDRLFGTFRLRADPSTLRLGLDGYDGPECDTFLGMLASPFRPHRRTEGTPPSDP